MQLEILTPEENVFKGEVSLINLPGSDGSFGVLNNHAALVSTLKEGKIKVILEDESEQFFDIKGGVVEVNNNNVIVLAE